ncbi:baculoviral IAP repeat-containing protein 7-A-like isoform X2 [Mercenaria mercenaria]|uniref:baculoviral IAP repeat-containing protein 7-A-like isoform X2 n=1 Tax=Mercenaria mercenaria TaxID=6596 RepID=UPI00234E5F8E|nr:baculoviral IAP repeat-containing protein 7-A-like isoform X2 [Mercenaria mercenaria]
MNRNKNVQFKESAFYQHETENNGDSSSLVVRILCEAGQNVLPHIDSLTNIFKNSLILYESGKSVVFTQLSSDLVDKLEDFTGKSDLRLKLESIGCWSVMYDSFLIYKLNDKDQLVLPKVQRTELLFERLKGKHPVQPVYVNFADLFLDGYQCGSYLPSRTLRDNKLMESYKYISLNPSKRIISLKRLRKVNIYTSRTSSFAFPLSGEISKYENFPQQVSEEQSGTERSVFAFSNGLSLAYTTDQASSLAIGESVYRYHRYNAATESESSHSSNIRQFTGTPSSTSQRSRHPNYLEYNNRLRSYARWTHRSPDPVTLTKAGFFYTNEGDLVRCYQCGIGLKDFSDGDDPLKEHVRHSSSCLYLIQLLGESRLTEWKRILQANDPELNRQRQLNERHNISAVANNFRHPEYQTLESRLETFTNWPAQMTQRPEQLADAGLYYTGFEDHVRCFACDGGLRRWDPEDDPWIEHCRWFPACPFAKEKKGDEYIALVQAAVALENEGNESTQSRGPDLSGAMEQMTLRDPEFRAALNEHKDACLEMGYQLTDFNEGVQELRNRETPLEENQRLKSYIICMSCGRNNVNALFLPCTHHRMCMECAERITHCPVCKKYIRQKIRTYLV